MKIFILTFLFCLLPFNLNAQALLSNCYDSSRSSSFNAQGINEEDKIEINENSNIYIEICNKCFKTIKTHEFFNEENL